MLGVYQTGDCHIRPGIMIAGFFEKITEWTSEFNTMSEHLPGLMSHPVMRPIIGHRANGLQSITRYELWVYRLLIQPVVPSFFAQYLKRKFLFNILGNIFHKSASKYHSNPKLGLGLK